MSILEVPLLESLYPVFTSSTPRPRRNGRPNYHQLHAKPLPLGINPLPTLIPQNPLSILQIAVTYIFQLLNQPSSHPIPRIRGYISPATQSIHVTDSASIFHLWQHGFFGKGSLSRSEPTWLDREKKRIGILAADTSEEHTASRREERRRFKNERARKEREAIDEKLMEELLVDSIASRHKPMPSLAVTVDGGEKRKPGKPTLRSKYEGLAEAALLSPTKGVGFFGGQRMLPTPPATPSPDSTPMIPVNQDLNNSTIDLLVEAPTDEVVEVPVQTTKSEQAPTEIENQEHLQLTPEEAFFLTYSLGILDIYPETTPIPPQVSPSSTTSAPTPLTTPTLLAHLTTNSPPHPSDPFLLNYTTYHHFRSHGWVVRPGLKFGVDYLLYLRGPVFSHAEFAVVIQPAYTHAYWKTNKGRKLRLQGGKVTNDVTVDAGDCGNDEQELQQQERQRSWHWLHCLQRVQSQVRKTLIVTWVDVPPPPIPVRVAAAGREIKSGEQEADVDISAMLQRYKVREMVIKRWIPNRSRD